MRLGIILFLFLTNQFFAQTQVIDTIIFVGLTKTSETYVRGLIECKKGEIFSDSIRREDERVLNNLNLFFTVESTYRLNENTNDYIVYFDIVESTYIYPIFDLSGFKSVLKLQLGVNNINFKGERKTIGLWYQHYDRHSFSGYHRVPRYKNQPFGHDFIISKYSTVEPLYFNNLVSIFNFDNYSIWLNGIYWYNKDLSFQVGLTPIYEVYLQLDSIDLNHLDLPAKNFSFWKYRVNTSANFRKIDYLYERIKGIESVLYLESVQTHNNPDASFYMAKLTTSYHCFIKKKGNLSWRHQFGISTNNESPFSPFVLDGFINIRGIGNRVARGTGIHFVNIEYRHTLHKNKFFNFQGITFLDAGSIRPPGENWTMLFDPAKTRAFAGLGIRLYSNKVYKAVFRLDYGIEISSEFVGGFSFGMGHFF